MPKKGNGKEWSNFCTIALISLASKIVLKTLQGFSSVLTENFPMFKLNLEKEEEPEVKLPASVGSLKKQDNSRKNVYFCFIDYAKSFDYVDHKKLRNS